MLAAGTEEFGDRLETAIHSQDLTIKQFAEKYNVSESTLYKITSGETVNFGVETLQQLITALQKEEGYDSPTIGLITTRSACDRAPSEIVVGGSTYNVLPLPANSIEEEIIKGVTADRDGVNGILCGPIAATTLEKVVTVPVGGLQFDRELMIRSLEGLAERL